MEGYRINMNLKEYLKKPKLYVPNKYAFWDDEHISESMLKAHLNPDEDGASRKHLFIESSVNWIAKIAPPLNYPFLLDLGCGPGLYAERFCDVGYIVTGIDYSKRSIAYANQQAKVHNREINYIYQNYLTLNIAEKYDVITLIYCDYAVLPVSDRQKLGKKIYQALKPGGKFIVDVFTPVMDMEEEDCKTWEFCEKGGFWSEKPYLCLKASYQYNDDDKTLLSQYVILTETDTR